MSEAQMWARLRPIWQGWGLDPVRIECPGDKGVPDVNTVVGWVELKFLLKWPHYCKSIVRLDHYTPEQRAWGMRRWLKRPGSCWLLLHIREGDQWLLFNALIAAQVVGRVNREALTRGATVSVGSPSAPELRAALDPA